MSAPHSRVAVVMRTEDRPVLLRRALASVAAQEFDDWQLVIVTAGAHERLGEVLADLDAGLSARIQVLALEACANPGEAINAALAATRSEYVVLHEAGDTWDPGFLSATVAHLGAHPEHAAVITGSEALVEEVHGSHLVETSRQRPAPHLPAAPLADLLAGRLAPVQLLYRRGVHDDLGAFREDAGGAAAWEFCLRLTRAHAVGIVQAPLAFTHHRPGDPGAARDRAGEALLRDAYLNQHLAGDGGGTIHLTHLVSAEFAELRRRDDDFVRRLGELERAAGPFAEVTARLDRIARRFDDISEHLGHLERLVTGAQDESGRRFDGASEHLGHLERRIGDVENTVREAGLAGTLRRKYQALRRKG